MRMDHFTTKIEPPQALQTESVRNKLQTAFKLKLNKNNHLEQFVDCSLQVADSPCNLPKNPITTRPVEHFSVCTQTPTPYRGSRDSHANAGEPYLNTGSKNWWPSSREEVQIKGRNQHG